MKKSLKNIWSCLGGVSGILLILYSGLVATAYNFITYYDEDGKSSYGLRVYVTIGVLIFACPILLRLVRKCRISFSYRPMDTKKRCLAALICYAISAIYFGIWFRAYAPGGISLDQLIQYNQCMYDWLNDWYPVMHTLLFFKLPLTLTGGNINSLVIFQILWFSAVMSYLCIFLMEHAGKVYGIIVYAYLLISPLTAAMVMYPLKDTAFAAGALLLTLWSVRIFLTRGEWLASWPHAICYACTMTLTTLFRHNAILFTGMLALATLFYVKRHDAIRFLALFVGLLILIKGPLYTALDVGEPDSRQLETVGLPLTIFGEVAASECDSMDQEFQDFVHSMASDYVWSTFYKTGNFNSVKWMEGMSTAPVEEVSMGQILRMTYHCFRYAPVSAWRGAITLTDMVYGIIDAESGLTAIEVSSQLVGIESTGDASLRAAFDSYIDFMYESGFKYLFYTIGVFVYLMILVILSRMKWNSGASWKKLLLVLPVLTYNFGTMLLLTGNDGRFFYETFLVVPVLVPFLLGTSCEEATTN